MSTSLDVAAALALRLAGATDDELDGVVNETLELLATEASADRTYVTLYHDDGTFENSHEWTTDGAVPQLPVIQRMKSSDFAYSYEMARRNEVLNAPDLMALPDEGAAEKRSFSAFNVGAVLQVPITHNGECVGLIGFNNYDTRASWPDDLIELVRLVGQAIGVALVRQRADRSIQRAYRAAERASHAKDELLAQVSHELRTPLHAMLGYAELLELEARSEADRDALSQIQFHGRRLLSMVEDLLVLADQADSSEREDLSLGPIVQNAMGLLRAVVARRQIKMVADESVHDVVVHSSPGPLRQVIYCALSGAIQSIPDGESIRVEATDDGRGLRFSASRATSGPGSGMVMPLARALIEGIGVIEDASDEQSSDVVIRFCGTGAAG